MIVDNYGKLIQVQSGFYATEILSYLLGASYNNVVERDVVVNQDLCL